MKHLNDDKQMTDVWRLPAIAPWEKTCTKHPTQKPLGLLSRIIMASTEPGVYIFSCHEPEIERLPFLTDEDEMLLGNITEDGVKFNIGLLQQYGRLKRVNGRKNGEWVVIDERK